jgi:hypothetical protein
MPRLPYRMLALFGLVGLIVLAGLLAPIATGATITPSSWTTKINTPTYDASGNPVTTTFTISVATGGYATSYAICLKMVDYPAYNTKAATYDTYKYLSYAPCVKFSWTSGSSSTHHVGTHFTFGGPGTYEVDWYVPDVPSNGGIQVGSGGTGTPQKLAWAKKGTENNTPPAWSPCPWDPQLQIAVWRPSRLKILNRCYTFTGSVTATPTAPNSLDRDRNWKISGLRLESMLRDEN